ncbi:MAG: PhoH family protein [Planctomycetota bacterium]
MRKNYILDANILLHEPTSVFNFADNTVIIPISVIEEIDRFKKESTERGYNARAVARLLDGLRCEQRLTAGVPLRNGGTLKVYCDPTRALTASGADGDLEILRVARDIQRNDPGTVVVIVTKDVNLRIRADASGLRAEDYETDRVRLADIETPDQECLVDPEVLTRFKREGQIELHDGQRPANEYLLLRASGPGRTSALGRVTADGRTVVTLRVPEGGVCGIRPRNKEQYFAIDALLNQKIQLVTLLGKAGTGKTLLAMAAAIHDTVRERLYRGVLVARPVVPVGRDVGYLPGDIERKLQPWIKPIVDTIEFLIDGAGVLGEHRDATSLLGSGLIEIQPLATIRGRSISNRYVVIDEAQNLTPLEVKTVITRIGQHSKVVLTGDPYQIDNPYIDANSNGFAYLVNRFRSQEIAAHVAFRKGERSALAELAANLL